MELQIGVSKVNKYASSESGDTLEFIERPSGGISVVLADGQRSGRSAKRIANKVVGKVIALLSEGVRDGAAARAASDALYHEKRGKVQATLNILSVDLLTKTIVITRNNPAPVYIYSAHVLKELREETSPVGLRRNTRPEVTEFQLHSGISIVLFTDGILNAGVRTGQSIDLVTELPAILNVLDSNAQSSADKILNLAFDLDNGRPVDDISVVVLQITDSDKDQIRRVFVKYPI